MPIVKNPQGPFYKSFDENLCGKNNFQYEVGGVFEPVEKVDDLRRYLYASECWLHCTDRLKEAIFHSQQRGEKIRVCIVEPLGMIFKEKAMRSGNKNTNNYESEKLKIVRELTQEEIIKILIEEDCPIFIFRKYIEPPFEALCRLDKKQKGFRRYVNDRTDLTDEQKRIILAK